MGKYVYRNGTRAAVNRFKSKVPTVHFCPYNYQQLETKFDNQREDVPKFNKPGRLNIVDDLLQKIRKLVIETRLPGTVISRRMVISIGNKFLKANDPNTLSEFGRTITLTDDWAGGILQSVDWVKHKGTIGKVEPSVQVLAVGKFTFQKAISTIVYDHDIPGDLIVKVDQAPISYMSPRTYTFNIKGAKIVPIKIRDYKR